MAFFKEDFIRTATEAEISEIVAVHKRSFEGFFLTFLGPAFLKELYTAALADSAGVMLVADQGDGICGFVMGTAQPTGFYRRLIRQRWHRFAVAAIVPTLKHPSIIPRLFRAFSMPEQVANKKNRATLMSIAVDPKMQGKGVGQALVQAFLSEAARCGVAQVDLTTDAENNIAVKRFYENLGFVCERSFTTPEGRIMDEYVRSLTA